MSNSPKSPTMTAGDLVGRPHVELWHVHHCGGNRVLAVVRRRLHTSGSWVAIRVYPEPAELGRYERAHAALEAIGVDPREVLSPGACKRAGLD